MLYALLKKKLDFCIVPIVDMNALGVYIDMELDFNEHITLMCAKVGKQLNVLERRKYALDKRSPLAIIRVLSCQINCRPLVYLFVSEQFESKVGNISPRGIVIELLLIIVCS